MEDYLILFSIILFFGIVVNKVTSYYDRYIVAPPPKQKKVYDVKYYSNGVELNQPFHIEYKYILKAMNREWKFEREFQTYLKEYPNESIFRVEAHLPVSRSYSYTYNHVKLARSYFVFQKEYLENLN